jgi:four helix bundle protein
MHGNNQISKQVTDKMAIEICHKSNLIEYLKSENALKYKNMSYKNLDIWKLARENVNQIHEITIQILPKFEMYETGSQIRRSSKSVKANIVEGYGRKEYKMDFIRFLTFALASNYETLDHLETLFETKSLKDEKLYHQIHERITHLSKKLYNFINAVHLKHNDNR